MQRLLPMFPLAALLLVTMGVGPCDSKQLGSVQDCSYQGMRFSVGASWTAACAACTCTTSGPVCQDVGCADASTDAIGNPGADGSTDLPLTCFDDMGNVFACPADAGGPDGAATDAASGTCFDASGMIVPCGDAGVMTCSSGGKTYPAGATFPATDGCNACTCNEDGFVSCTVKACESDAGASGSPGDSSCLFDATYVYGWVGGLQPFTDVITLAPPASYTIVRTPVSNNVSDSGMCAPALPPCGTGNGKIIDAPIVMADLADPTVQLLLSLTTTQTITLGMRLTPDDPLFSFQRNGSAGFQVGSPCLSTGGNCTTIPDAVLKLRTDLLALDQQQRMDPACAGPLSSGN